ncbi:MAG: single-stranded-DNA-specific exonuclease RecJ [Microgenomates group bacterium]
MRWQKLSSQKPQNFNELEQILLKNRNIDSAKQFFEPIQPNDISATDIGFDQKQLDIAIKRFETAFKKNEDILIFGDYDADGICATAVLWNVLISLGAKIRPFIPQREVHGYGLSIPALEEIFTLQKPKLIITVDNGIVAHEAVDFAVKNSVDIIITDHHQPESIDSALHLPKATSVVHSTKLCGTTVSWMFAREIVRSVEKNKKISQEIAQKTIEVLQNQLDLCGIATIADQVPLLEFNRSFAVSGIRALQKSQRPGIIALCQDASIDQLEITSDSIGFGIAPRINAMGRLAHGLDALRLLCTGNLKKAKQYAQVIGNKNTERKDMTTEMYTHALMQAKLQAEEHILIVASSEYHEGIIGLIAGRLSERFSKPAIVLHLGKTEAKASARSVAGVNIVDLIRLVQSDLLSVGGHPMAAGFGLLLENFEKIQKKLFSLAREQISQELLTPGLEIDCDLPWKLVTDELVQLQDKFAPFGSANPRPLFAIDSKVVATKRLGAEGKHLKLMLCEVDQENASTTIEALAWNKGEWAETIEEGQKLHIAAKVERNIWQGRSKIQLILRDIQNSDQDLI